MSAAAATATRTYRGRLTPTARARAARDRCRQTVCTLLVTGIVLLLTTTTKSPPLTPPPPPPEFAPPPPPPPLQLRTTSTPPTDLASFVRAFSDYDFIHIPKTGGTSVDAVVAANASVYNLITKKLWARNLTKTALYKWGSPWHQPTDVLVPRFRRIAPLPRGRGRAFCVVREPAARYASELHYRRSEEGKYLKPTSISNERAREVARRFRRGDKAAALTGEHELHLQPQSWFVWAADGTVLCDCVLSFERLVAIDGLPNFCPNTALHRRETGCHDHRGEAPSRGNETLPEALRQLYRADERVWRAVRDADARGELCWRPAPLPGGVEGWREMAAG